ncbi:MAG: hypothetical protein GXY36_02365 [Chloroflexi bacterium]|jgi:hypothetical protein|nr:hypothetical protein [Chloroflexota bacterium]
MQRHMLLICHSADGHFADGNREAVKRVLEQTTCTFKHREPGSAWYTIMCPDGGLIELNAPGLEGNRPFHRMEVIVYCETWTRGTLNLLMDLMRAGGFGLLDSLDTAQVIVADLQQVIYFPWLPEPPLFVRSSRDLGQTLGLAS